MRLTADFKENNLDLLRLVFAVIVVLYHTSGLTGIPGLALLGEYCSPHFAVHGFFVISGLLIYRSYTRSTSIRSYLEKRVRRIYPAYFVVVVGAAALLPLLSPGFPAHTYGGAFWKYIGANLLFLNFLAPNLPGVTIGEGAVVGAAAVVTKDVPPGHICVGNPGRLLSRTVYEPRPVRNPPGV